MAGPYPCRDTSLIGGQANPPSGRGGAARMRQPGPLQTPHHQSRYAWHRRPLRHGQGGRYNPKEHHTRIRYSGLTNPTFGQFTVAEQGNCDRTGYHPTPKHHSRDFGVRSTLEERQRRGLVGPIAGRVGPVGRTRTGTAGHVRQSDRWRTDSATMITHFLRYSTTRPIDPAQEPSIDAASAIDFARLAITGTYDGDVIMSTDTDLLPAP